MLHGAEREAALALYAAGHPTAFYVRFDDYSAYRLQVEAIRYVGGFGRMSWVTAADYAAAEPDPLLGGPATAPAFSPCRARRRRSGRGAAPPP